ncbi:DUF998 domain-containing protein [Kineococcus sp. SYSU DK005]|uniref:DUF998 domain-containing protein n=1 Tax=Kineococcus sp. SYSU DK005 TaxID=3383126 RepID=UPI003D7CCCFF
MTAPPRRAHGRPSGTAAGAVPRARTGLAVLAGAANANFLLAPLLGTRVDLAAGVISELSVPGQPGAVWFRLGDGSAGLLCSLLALPVALGWYRSRHDRSRRDRSRHGRSRREGFGALCLGVFGVSTLLSAIVPLACAPSLGPCPASAAPAELVHDAVSVVGTLAAVVGVAALAHRARGWWLWPAVVLTALVTAGTGAYEVVTFLQGGGGAGGAAQRLQVVAVSCWVVLEVAHREPDRGPGRGRARGRVRGRARGRARGPAQG